LNENEIILSNDIVEEKVRRKSKKVSPSMKHK